VGDRVDICAPGGDIFSCTKDDTYLRKSGTSMAAPVVTGVAGLVWSANENLTGAEVKEIVCKNTRDLVPPSNENHFDFLGYQAYPMVNAKMAVEAALLMKDGYCNVFVTTGSKEEVTFTDENGNEFIFETNYSGSLSCVLKEGNYEVKTESTVKNVVVRENEDIIM